jgi:hypothetical protein
MPKSISAVSALSLIGIAAVARACGSMKDLSGETVPPRDSPTTRRPGLGNDIWFQADHQAGPGYGHIAAEVPCELQHLWRTGATNVCDQVRRRQRRTGVCVGEDGDGLALLGYHMDSMELITK